MRFFQEQPATGWVRTETRFRRRRKVFTVQSSRLQQTLENSKTIEELEANLRKLVLAMRPSLEGCCIEHFEYDVCRDQWLIGVSHASFEPITDMTVCSTETLIEEG